MTTTPLGPNHPRVRSAAKLRRKKSRCETGCILIEGARLTADALHAGVDLRELFATAAFLGSEHADPIRRLVDAARIPLIAITEAAANKLADTRTPQGVFAVVAFAPRTGGALPLPGAADRRAPVVLVADGVADPGNLGTIIRSAAALGAHEVIVSGGSCDVRNPKCVRATMGAIFRVPVATAPEAVGLVEALRGRGLHVVAAAANDGDAPSALDLTGPTALVLGAEAEGLSDRIVAEADAVVSVPMCRGTESLNVAAAATILLYEAARQRGMR
jgi:TrmH family RNA methyltransferase